MPTSSSAFTLDKKRVLRCKKKSLTPNSCPSQSVAAASKFQRSQSTLSLASAKSQCKQGHNEPMLLLKTHSDGTVHVSRTSAEKAKHPDRLSLDRRALTMLPVLDSSESNLRLLSLQHNLIVSLDTLLQQSLPILVFLDVYDNQVERMTGLQALVNLRVLLLGKNRIRKLEGLEKLQSLEVLDLHGNQIVIVEGLEYSQALKVLNLAGNQIRATGTNDLQGLRSLEELNLRRNKLKRLEGFEHTPNLQKLYLSNNDIQGVEDIKGVGVLKHIRELSIDGNPVFHSGECVSFLIAFLPSLALLNGLRVNEKARKAAMAWRRNKEGTCDAFSALAQCISFNGRRDEVISNARTNWELLRTQHVPTYTSKQIERHAHPKPDSDIITTKLVKKEKARKIGGSLLPSKACFGLGRANSLETDSSSNQSDKFRLPPILLPIINRMEATSTSSIGPNVDSSISSSLEAPANVQLGATETASDEDVPDFPHEDQETIKSSEDPPAGKPEAGSNLSTSGDSTQKPSRVKRAVKSAANSRGTKVAAKTCSRPITAKPPSMLKRGLVAEEKSVISLAPAPREREQGGDYLIEICGRHLNVYGHGALRFIEKTWCPTKAHDVHTVTFNYANFNAISGVLGKVKTRFPNAENFVFKETNIFCLGQLNAMAEIQGMASLHIDTEGNPVTAKGDWREYAVYRLAHWGLKAINDQVITEEEIASANASFASLSDLVLMTLPNETLHPLLQRMQINVQEDQSQCKQWLLQADAALRSVVSKEALQWRRSSSNTQEELIMRQRAKLHMTKMVHELCETMRKMRLFNEHWPQLLHDIVSDALIDYSQLEFYTSRKLLEMSQA